jgi:putative membrane protein
LRSVIPSRNAGRRGDAVIRRPGIAAATLAIVVYAVLGYALSGRPPAQLPPALARFVECAPHLIAVINAAALFFLLSGWRAIRRGEVPVHRKYMLGAAVLISAFLVLYVSRVALGGTKSFAGPAAVRAYLYLPMLVVHILLSVVSVPLVIYNLLVGLTRPADSVGDTAHPRIGRCAVALWSVSLLLGIGVYVLLNLAY